MSNYNPNRKCRYPYTPSRKWSSMLHSFIPSAKAKTHNHLGIDEFVRYPTLSTVSHVVLLDVVKRELHYLFHATFIIRRCPPTCHHSPHRGFVGYNNSTPEPKASGRTWERISSHGITTMTKWDHAD